MSEVLWFVHQQIVPAALSLLPSQMNTLESRAMLLATGLQESGFRARTQMKNGPATGFWQFEKNGGVKEILTSTDTAEYATKICQDMLYTPSSGVIHPVLADNWPLAAVFARLLLWRHPLTMPKELDVNRGWKIYVQSWRPGDPGPERWPNNFKTAWQIVKA